MKRLGIFIFFDPQGIVDDYVLYLLKEMSGVCSQLVTVCNGRLTDEGRDRLSQYSKTIYCRDNQGMDAGALKDYFLHLGRREYWSAFDELVWFNDTCYGPLVPMQDVFREMEQREPCDFWGITVHAKSSAQWPGRKESGIPEHLQSYFIVVRQKLLQDERFFGFWKDLSISDNFNATVANYELSMTRAFSSWGYTYGVFCDTRKLDSNPNYVCNLTAEAMYLLVSQYRCPFVKRKSFIRSKASTLIHTNGEQVSRVMDYIRSNTPYDTALIYRNLMRLYDQSLWRGNLCHDYVLSAEHSSSDPVPPAFILAELDHPDAVQELSAYLDTLPESCVLEAVTRAEALVPVIEKQLPVRAVHVLPDRGNGLASLFSLLTDAQLEKYPYFCILQEHWGTPTNDLHLPESSTRLALYGNLVHGSDFIRNLLHCFEEAPLLGILEPPPFPQAQDQINRKRKTPGEYAKDWGISLPARQGEKPIVCQPSLWCRREIISSVKNRLGSKLSAMDSGSLECMMGYLALADGYYCGEVMEQRYAACLLENQRWIVESIGNQKLLLYRKQFQTVAAINSGRLKPENADISALQLLRLMAVTACYCIEKRFHANIPQEKKETFFFGVRDVYHAYRRVKASSRQK